MVLQKFKYRLLFKLIALLFIFSCDDYLDIVPDKTQELSLLFEREETAYGALADCYSYLPQNDGIYSTYVLASDEITVPVPQETDAIRIMKGQQNSSTPMMSYWSGYGAAGKGQGSLWQAIRSCNTLIENMDLVVDMTQDEKDAWKAEAELLKAYYHFLLVNFYGPIPITDRNIPISADDNAVRVSRNTIDECFTYIVETIDKAILKLPTRVTSNNDLGRVDQVIAKALKSRVLMFSASPFFNGNSEFYADFINDAGVHYFNQSYDENKWVLAAEAAREAIEFAIANGSQIYYYNETPPAFETNFSNSNIQSQYNYRYATTDLWTNELIWGNSKPVGGGEWWRMQAGVMIKSPTVSSNEAAWQWIAPSINFVEEYYTKNGLPIEEDLTFDYENRYDLTTIFFNNADYAQPFEKTSKLNLDRSPRFYASIAFDRGYGRTWGELWELQMRSGEDHGRQANTNDYLTSGYALLKLAHQDSEGDAYNKVINYPWPIIKLSELYLNFAEASNEAYGPSQEIYDALNVIRARSGIPNVEDAWSDTSKAATPNKHTNKEGLRSIIKRERALELAFEGHRYNDIRRWKEADEKFNTNILGWSVNNVKDDDYYTIETVSERIFVTPRDYLHPISFQERSINPNITQNPYW